VSPKFSVKCATFRLALPLTLVAALVVLVSSERTEAQLCRVACMPGESRDAAGCCAATSSPSGHSSDPPAERSETNSVGCPPGQARTPSTAGNCCYANQVWHEGRCRGVPSSCPSGYSVDSHDETCEVAECALGTERAEDGVTCCYPGQFLVNGMCRGVPSRCPQRTAIAGETCLPLPPVTLRLRLDPRLEELVSYRHGWRVKYRFRVIAMGSGGGTILSCVLDSSDDQCIADVPPETRILVEVYATDRRGWRRWGTERWIHTPHGDRVRVPPDGSHIVTLSLPRRGPYRLTWSFEAPNIE
jgi:hypothetical protein